MEKLVLIDGNSIMNRAFYGIMSNKILTSEDGKCTNAIYGFLAMLFRILEEVKPEYIAVAFDVKGPTKRHEMYEGYKASRKGMPNELAEQMPIMKEVLNAMNIEIVEKQGYEGDDILGTLAKKFEKKNLQVLILSGDRDTFQLASDKIIIQIPRTKVGKTEIEYFDEKKVEEVYGLKPKQLIEVKALQGDTSDDIPGVPGIGEKTALSLIKKYKTIENLYKMIEEDKDDLRGKQRENLIENKELAFLSKKLGTIDTKVPLDEDLEKIRIKEWDKEKVLEIFRRLLFSRYIEKFNLEEEVKPKEPKKELFKIEEKENIDVEKIKKDGKIFYYFETKNVNVEGNIIQEEISSISIYFEDEQKVQYTKNEGKFLEQIKEIFENKEIEKRGSNLTRDYILLKQQGITMQNINYDAEIAAYVLNSSNTSKNIERILEQDLKIQLSEYIGNREVKSEEQLNLFEEKKEDNQEKIQKSAFYAYGINEYYKKSIEELRQTNSLELFQNIDMPTVEILSSMQWNGMYVNVDELDIYAKEIKEKVENLTKEIQEMSGEEFNINSTKQLGEVLFEKLKLPIVKKNKSGYSTDVDVLEKLKDEHPIIEKILEYRQVMKLNSTYVEGLKPYINPKTKRIHSFFHQTITATGRISSTDPNLQNIPTRMELGKRLRRVFEPEKGYVYIDADYSQIELRVLAHMAEDKHMISAFKRGEDIHKQAASKVFKVPLKDVTKEQRTNAKAVNFGIVYGISDFGLGEQLGIKRNQAKKYIDEYLEQYSGIKNFMDSITETAKEQGYVETIFHRRRYIPELKSNNFMVRQFGARAAMNTPIQGTAADIMKMAMINVNEELKKNNLKSKIVLQVHDEMMIEAPIEEKEQVKEILKKCMENVTKLKVPLIADISEAENWYECK